MPGDKDFNELITSFRLLKMIAVTANGLENIGIFGGGGSGGPPKVAFFTQFGLLFL